ncbi:MAG: YggS family pyridoxal phosphate-dependent enzyme [Flavobacteriales bacterium]
MDSISNNLKEVKAQLPGNVSLVAVSKTKPNSAIEAAYSVGQRVFGENRIQELVAKSEELPKDIEWHMIGHLQSNKVKYIAPFISLIHAVDKPKLLAEINKEALKNNRVIKVLLQFHIAEEDSKFGMNLPEAEQLLESEQFQSFQNIEVAGVMGMATFTSDQKQVRNEFKTLKSIFDKLKNGFFQNQPSFKEISMGMSGDYKLAIEEGSTMVRVGSSIFGKRG